MTHTLNMESLKTPVEEVSTVTGDSDAAALADELGQIGVHTVDDDKIQAPVEKIDVVDEDTVRLWYRFPTGELIPEDFEKPMMWNVIDSKLARVVTHAGLTGETFSELETRDDVTVVLEETKVRKKDVDLDELLMDAPLSGTQFDDDATAEECLYFRESDDSSRRYVTWESVDPLELVDDDRFSETDEEEADGIDPFVKQAAWTGFVTCAVVGGVYLFLTALLGAGMITGTVGAGAALLSMVIRTVRSD